jgi:cytidine deaminase
MKDKLLEKLNNAYAPYSKYRVSAAVVLKDDHVYMGVNVENASYGATICAERNAINNAIKDGYKKGDFKTLYVMVENDLAFPCFICRQVINEFFESDAKLILMNRATQIEYDMKEILCHPFGKEDLV